MARRRSRSLPAFCITIYSLSLIFLVFRVFDVTFALGRLFLANAEAPPWRITDSFHLLAGLGMVMVGIPANLLLLFGKPVGRLLGWCLVVIVLGSIQVDLCRGLIWQSQHAAGSSDQLVAIAGLAGELLCRGILLCLYVTAMIKFSKWLRAAKP